MYIYIGGLMEYISKKVAAYGQFVLVYIQTLSMTLKDHILTRSLLEALSSDVTNFRRNEMIII